ncbi:MAG: sulfatase-like hydrolase/transferase [Flavobacteriales bacterium]
MRIQFYKILAVVFAGSIPFACAKNKASAGCRTTKVIIVVMDGARYSETWGDPSHQHIPSLHSLANQGCVFTQFYKENHTYTCSGHTEMLTGVDQEIDNGGNELPYYASFMQYALAQYDAPQNNAWVIASKEKLHVLTNCQHVSMAGKNNPAFTVGVNGIGTGNCHDSITIQRVYSTMSQYAPDFMLINFREPDFSAHAFDSLGYLKGIRYVDSCFNMIYNWTQTMSAYTGKTALFLTNDHGRHLNGVADGYAGHGDLCEGCRHIFLYATGPDFRKNASVATHYQLRDIAATVAFMLKLKMPYNQGKVITDLFK